MQKRYSDLIAPDPVTFRNRMRTSFANRFELDEKQATNLEIAVYNFAIKEANNTRIVKKWENKNFAHLYMDRLRSLWLNMQNVPELVVRYKSGDITPEQWESMTHQEMKPERWLSLIEKRAKREMQSDETQASTDMFTCKKCKSKKCSYYELQTRSADEPSTIFITCLDCGKHWKQ